MPKRVYKGTAPRVVPFWNDDDRHPTFRTVKPGDTLDLSEEAASRLDKDAPHLFVEPERIEIKKWRDLR